MSGARIGLTPARVTRVDGVPFAPDYGDVYASRDGALGQARHVFLGGTGLPQRWRDRPHFTIVENGFGLGNNFLATWQAWRDDPRRPHRLHYVALELHPAHAADLRACAPAPLAPLAQALADAWPPPLAGLHRIALDDGAVTLTLAFGEAGALAPQLAVGADALYLDGFAPDRNPAMWAPPLLKALARLARAGATLATWCTARAVREPLAAAGFALALRPGYGRKRQMLVGDFAPRWAVRRHEPPAAYAGERRAVVVGAGLAGAACALALAQRGWQVEVLERGAHAAAGASALPAGLLHPQWAADDSRLARLTRAGFLLAHAWLARLDPQRRFWRDDGVFVQAADAGEAQAWAAQLARAGVPAGFVQALDAHAAAALIGLAPWRGGLWFPQGATVGAAHWVRAMLAADPARIRLHAAVAVHGLVRDGDGWRVQTAVGDDVSRGAPAPVVVVAAALEAARLLALREAPLRAVRGRATLADGTALAALRGAVGGDGYLLRVPDGRALVGATYELDAPSGADPEGETRAHAGNLARLARLLAAPPALVPTGCFDQWRAVARDRLPLAGPIADEPLARASAHALRGVHPADLPRRRGLYGAFALGSRGLVLAPLLGELVASQIEGEPWPVARDLAAGVDPARFLLARLRAGRTGPDAD